MNKKIFREFIAGTILAVMFFVIWNMLIDFDPFTWQELVVSFAYGGYVLCAHLLMKKNGFLKGIAYLMLTVPFVLAGLWYAFCIGMNNWAANY